jgi:hypothetical protein
MRMFVGCCILFACVLAVVEILSGSDNAKTSTTPASSKASTPPPPAQVWAYNKDTDEITGKARQWACTTSSDRGGAQLCFRRYGSELNAYLQLPDTIAGGQFFCYEDHCSTKIKLDDRAAYTVQGNSEGSGNTRIMFLPSPAQLLANVKKSKSAKIEAPIYSDGHDVLHFDVTGVVF